MKFWVFKVFLISIVLPFHLTAQAVHPKSAPKDFGFTKFTIKGSSDSIGFIVGDTSFNKRKPVFLFCQGSYPTALFWKEDSAHTWRQFLPFAYEKYMKEYTFVIISKPGIPVMGYTADRDYKYTAPLTGKIPEEFYHKNYLDYYVTQANDVIKYLIKQPWVDTSKIVICGHSQGSKVVSKLGAINKYVTEVVYLSGNPLGRFDQNIRQLRKDALAGKITNEEAQKEINLYYTQWKSINIDPDNTHSDGGDTNKGWVTFSAPLLSWLLRINAPVFIGYGTSDNTSDYCDLLPLDFIRVNKNNYTMMPYLGYDHNFFGPVYNKQGKQVSTKGHWDDVANDIFSWLKTH